MAIKYLAGDRLIGTAAERAAMSVGTPQTDLVNTGNLGTSYNLVNEGLAISQTAQDSGDDTLNSADKHRTGLRVDGGSNGCSGRIITKVGFELKKTGSPTGNATVVVCNDAGTTIYDTIGTLDVSTLTTSYAWKYFENTSATHTIVDSDKIELRYSGGDGSNTVNYHWKDSDEITSGSYITYNGSSYTTNSSRSPQIKIYGTVTFTDSSKSGFGQVANFFDNPRTSDPTEMLFEKEFTSQSLIGGDDYCVGGWAKLVDTDGDQEVFELGTTGSGVYNNVKIYHWSGNKFRAIIYVDSGSYNVITSANDDANDGDWHHFMVERDGSTNTFYIDNTSVGTWSNSDSFAYFDRVRMGRFWEGEIDETFMLRRKTTSAEKTSMQTSQIKDISSMFSDSDLKFYFDCNSSFVYPNLPNGTIFEESDTGKHYMFDGTDTWNEIT